MAAEIEDLKHDTVNAEGVNLPDMRMVLVTTTFKRKYDTEVGILMLTPDAARKLYAQIGEAISEAIS